MRNILIVVAIAALVAFLPGGETSAGLVGAVLSTLITVAFVALLARFYRERRMDLFSMPDRWRLQLYGALGLLVLLLAGAGRLFETGAGTLLWLIGMSGCVYLLVLCFRQYRQYVA